jgi:hypothetical protein
VVQWIADGFCTIIINFIERENMLLICMSNHLERIVEQINIFARKDKNIEIQ